MTKQEIIQSVGKPILMPLGILQLLLLILFISSPFIWIWHSWNLAWKIGLTGFFGCIVVYLVYKLVENCLTEIVDSEIEKQTPPKNKSKFQQKMEEMQQNKRNL
jgi:hypothetical protein